MLTVQLLELNAHYDGEIFGKIDPICDFWILLIHVVSMPFDSSRSKMSSYPLRAQHHYQLQSLCETYKIANKSLPVLAASVWENPL